MPRTSSLHLPCALPTARVAAAVNEDWHRVVHDPAARAAAERWAPLAGAAEGDLAAVLAAVGGDRGVPIEQADRDLARLVRCAADDAVAARVVLQRLVPGLVHAARRRRHHGLQHAFDELVGTAWVVVRTYPLDRRPVRVAANLCRDAEYQAFVRPARLRSADERPGGVLGDDGAGRARSGASPGRRRPGLPPLAAVMRSDVPAAADEVGAVLLDALAAGVARDRVALVAEIHLAGRHPSELAGPRMSERTVRFKRDTTVRQMVSLLRTA